MNRSRTTQAAEKKTVIRAPTKERVRDRIMRTASKLFYCRGIHAVGVDSIASEAGTNKMSFYRNFASKDELVAEYLREAEAVGWKWWDETVAEHPGDPRCAGRGALWPAGSENLHRRIARVRACQCRRGNHRLRPSGAPHH